MRGTAGQWSNFTKKVLYIFGLRRRSLVRLCEQIKAFFAVMQYRVRYWVPYLRSFGTCCCNPTVGWLRELLQWMLLYSRLHLGGILIRFCLISQWKEEREFASCRPWRIFKAVSEFSGWVFFPKDVPCIVHIYILLCLARWVYRYYSPNRRISYQHHHHLKCNLFCRVGGI